MKTKLLLLMLFMNSILFAQAQWRPMGPDDFNQNSSTTTVRTSLDNNDVVHIAVFEPSMGNKISVKKYNGTSWDAVGSNGFTSGSGSGMVIEFDGNNVPYLAYADTANNDKMTVYKFNGTIWELVGSAGFTPGSIDQISLDFTTTNVPYIAYSDFSLDPTGGKLVVRRFNGTTWPIVGVAGISQNIVQGCCLRMDANDVPHVGYGFGSFGWVKKFNGFSWVDVGATPITGSSQFLNDYMEFGTDNVLYVLRKSAVLIQKFDGTNWVELTSSSTAFVGSNPTLALDSNNVPYVSSINGAGNTINKYVGVQRLNGTSWEQVGSFLPLFGCKRLQLDTNNIPYLDGSAYGGSNIIGSNIYKYNGLAWDLLNSKGISVDNAKYTSLAVANNNTPYIAYQDEAVGGKATVKKYNGTDWTAVGTIGLSPGQAEFTSIRTKNNVPYLAYKDLSSAGKASVQKFNGTNWEFVGGQGFSNGEVFSTAIAFGGTNAPYVVYKDVANANKITVKTFNGTTWVTVGNQGFSAGQVFDTSIAVTSNNTIYVAYKDVVNGNKITVQGFNGTFWQVLGTAGFSNGEVNYPKITVDGGDIPQVVYQDISYSKKAIVKRFNGAIWENLGAVTGISSGQVDYTDIATDTNNLPYILYRDATNRYKATVQKFTGTAWSVPLGTDLSTLATTSGFSALQADYCALVLDNNNVPIVAYKSPQAFAKYFGSSNAIVLSIDENLVTNDKIATYPNPVQSTFSISSKNNIEEIAIFDFLGKEILNLKNVSQNINIEFLPKGFYIVKVKTDETTKTLKIIKE